MSAAIPMILTGISALVTYNQVQNYIAPTYSPWAISYENENSATFTRTCLSNSCDSSYNELFLTQNWTDISECSKPCNTGLGYKTMEDPNNPAFKLTSRFQYPCNTQKCSELASISDWEVASKDISGVTFSRTCTPDYVCEDIETTIFKKWDAETICPFRCYNEEIGYKYNKSFLTVPDKPTTIVYSDDKICNDIPCEVAQYSPWEYYYETENDVIFQRRCLNPPICSNNPEQVILTLKWDVSENCTTFCGDGYTYKQVNDPNNPSTKFMSKERYPCRLNKPCADYVDYTPWQKTNENITGVTFTRRCTSKVLDRDICSLLGESTSMNSKWNVDGPCSALCYTNPNAKPSQYKQVYDPNNTGNLITSDNRYLCNDRQCPEPSYSNWKFISQDSDYAYFQRTCTNDYCTNPNLLTMKQPWTNTLDCSEPCDGGIQYKEVTFTDSDGTTKTLRSLYPFDCNTSKCSNLATYSEWYVFQEDASGVLFKRDCMSAANICAKLPNSELELYKPWLGITRCPELCDTGVPAYNKRYMYNPNQSKSNEIIYSMEQLHCNTNKCPQPDFTPWAKQFENSIGAAYTRSCNNAPFCTEPYYTIDNSMNKFMPWTDISGSCSKACNGGEAYKTGLDPTNKTVTSQYKYSCNTELCSDVTTLGQWVKTEDTDNEAIFRKPCTETKVGACAQLEKDAPNALQTSLVWNTPGCELPCNTTFSGKKYVKKYVIDPNNPYTTNRVYKDVDTWCNTDSCPAPQYNAWGQPVETDTTMTWTRTCKNPPFCTEPYQSSAGLTYTSQSIGMTTCSASCGNGTNNKIYRHPDGYDVIGTRVFGCKIKECPIDCLGYWGGCNATCDWGTQTYYVTQNAAHGGSACEAAHGQTRSCYQRACVCPGGTEEINGLCYYPCGGGGVLTRGTTCLGCCGPRGCGCSSARGYTTKS